MTSILVLHGPNLNLLGIREPDKYGVKTLDQINIDLKKESEQLNCTLSFLQSQAEHTLIEAIHQAYAKQVSGIIFNPAAFTHTSIALRDALLATSIPFVEVHLSNIHARESFRQFSYFSDIAIGVISGFGSNGYIAALDLLTQTLESSDGHP